MCDKPIPPYLIVTYLGLSFGIIACLLTDPSATLGYVVFPLMIFGSYDVGTLGPERDYV